MNQIIVLRTILMIIGAVIVVLGLNIGLGGIKTLGWQTVRDFVAITDSVTFGTQDNHIRFIGGVLFGVGVVFFAGGIALQSLRPTLIVLAILIAVAGLFRLSALDAAVFTSMAIVPSLALEVVGFPLLAWWLSKGVRPAQ